MVRYEDVRDMFLQDPETRQEYENLEQEHQAKCAQIRRQLAEIEDTFMRVTIRFMDGEIHRYTISLWSVNTTHLYVRSIGSGVGMHYPLANIRSYSFDRTKEVDSNG